jgi:hypothetical protein
VEVIQERQMGSKALVGPGKARRNGEAQESEVAPRKLGHNNKGIVVILKGIIVICSEWDLPIAEQTGEGFQET